MEQWSKISANPKYEVSTYGRIRKKDKIKALHSGTNGYYEVALYSNGRRKHYRVNRLVAMQFIPNPNDYPEVNHKDGNKHNNHINNLEWVTKSQNMVHAYSTGIIKPSRGMTGHSNPNAGRKGKPIRIVETGEVFKSSLECESKKGLNNRHINDCLKGRQRTHGGYHFEYI